MEHELVVAVEPHVRRERQEPGAVAAVEPLEAQPPHQML